MSFPNYKKNLYFFWEVETPDGWEDRGKVEPQWSVFYHDYNDKCDKCGSTLHVGREKDETFLFCPKCLEKRNYLYNL